MAAINREDVMTCRNFRNGTCPKSDPIVLEERDDTVQMGCKTCRGGWIVTLPAGKAKARYENRLEKIREAERRERERRARPVYFT